MSCITVGCGRAGSVTDQWSKTAGATSPLAQVGGASAEEAASWELEEEEVLKNFLILPRRRRLSEEVPQGQVNMEHQVYIVFLSGLLWLNVFAHGARQSQDIKCGACRALVDEMEWAVSQVDPKKMIQTGSFRINPDGSQSIKEVPLARSEGHLLELMEEVCDRMKDYGERVDPVTNRKTFVRHTSRDGTSMDLSDVTLDTRVSASLKFACETIVEQNEDEIIEFFAHETENVKDRLCSKRTGLEDDQHCTVQQQTSYRLTVHLQGGPASQRKKFKRKITLWKLG
ncbi:hypothetical protein NFI96_016427 [Prochilodus magdalenae]|nr:hypothetical protein NFI96_016427 [Prochilodus magdalenae]